MELGLIITSVVLGIALILTILNCLKTKKKFKSELEEKSKELDKLHSDLNRYNGIVSIEKEIENKNSELAELQKTAKSFNESINDLQTLNSELDKLKNTKEIEEKELNEIQNKASNLNDRYTNAKSIFKELERDIKLYRNDLEFVELGIYEPIFDYETSEKYKEQLTNIKTKQKQLIKGGNACICNTSWHVGNSRKQGEIMTRRYINLTLRAFNGECDTLISKVRWNNVKRFEERITKAFNAINKLGKSNDVHITDKYLKLKLDELHLAYELEHKKQQEKEEQRAIREEQEKKKELKENLRKQKKKPN